MRNNEKSNFLYIKNIFELTETHSKGVSCCVSSWRLAHLDITSLIRLSNNEIPSLDRDIGFPGIRGLSGLITLNLLSENPEILECYLNLELKSCLLNLPPDSNYIGRLKQSTITDLVLKNWWEVNEERESSREEAMNNLSRLHQIQDDYDQLVQQRHALPGALPQPLARRRVLLQAGADEAGGARRAVRPPRGDLVRCSPPSPAAAV